MHDPMYAPSGRVAFKGQVFSAPLDWGSVYCQLQAATNEGVYVALPLTGALLEARVRVSITAGLVDLSKCIKEATVRRDVVVQLIRRLRDAGHPDYRRVCMREVEQRVQELAPTDAPAVPECVLELVEDLDDAKGPEETDKAATPAERLHDAAALGRDMDRARPQLMVTQRDSDAQRDVEASRLSALGSMPELFLQTGSAFLPQFETEYIPRVFCLTLPWYVGGPDFPGRGRPRRASKDAPRLSLDGFTAMMARRVEAQIGRDWDFNPALWSLAFASKVNQSMSMSIRRALRRNTGVDISDEQIGVHTARILQTLNHGEYITAGNQRRKIRGDVSKLPQAVGLTEEEKALLRNYHFISGRLAGTRQVRRAIGHVVFSSRVVYGCPIFMTVTPSERHSGLAIRLSRCRRGDPACSDAAPNHTHPGAAQETARWAGYNAPRLYPAGGEPSAEAAADLPQYDLRRLMTSRDPLACVHAFWVSIRVVLASLLGIRMCPAFGGPRTRAPNCYPTAWI